MLSITAVFFVIAGIVGVSVLIALVWLWRRDNGSFPSHPLDANAMIEKYGDYLLLRAYSEVDIDHTGQVIRAHEVHITRLSGAPYKIVYVTEPVYNSIRGMYSPLKTRVVRDYLT